MSFSSSRTAGPPNVLGIATMGFPKTNGTFARETLQPLAKVNIDSLKDFDYFTYATVEGKRDKDAFNEPLADYWLD